MQFCVAVRKCWFVRVVDWAGRVYLFGYRAGRAGCIAQHGRHGCRSRWGEL